jgi:hypothetical protein
VASQGCFNYRLDDRNESMARLAQWPGISNATAALGYHSTADFIEDIHSHPEALCLLSTFCLTPPGDTPTRRGFWDALLMGCVPVVFSELSRRWPWHLPRAIVPSVSVMVPEADVVAMSGADLARRLQLELPRVASMRAVIADHATSFQYSFGDHGDDDDIVGPDALDIAISGLILTLPSGR